MDFTTEEKELIDIFYHFRNSNHDIEYEVLYHPSKLNYFQFECLLKFLKNEMKTQENMNDLEYLGQNTSLDIFYQNESNTKNIPLRYTIENTKNISRYCKTNSLDKLPYTITYKSRFKVNDDNWSTLYIPNYDIKINLKRELEFEKERKEFLGQDSETNIIANKKLRELLRLKKNNLEKDLLKTFRLKNRFSFRYNNVRIDLTTIKSSKKEIINGRERMIPVKQFIDSNIINEDKTYEVEVEFYPKTDINIDLDTFNNNLKNISTIMLQGLQNYPVIISKSESNIVLDLFKKTIKRNHYHIIRNKIETINSIKQIHLLKNSQDDKTAEINEIIANIDNKIFYKKLVTSDSVFLDNLITRYNRLLSNIENDNYIYSRNSTYFIGPKVVSLEMDDIRENNQQSIISGYSVTDKADGIGKLLYIAGDNEIDNRLKGNIYLIDNNLRVYATNLTISDDTLNNTILNGEYLNHDISKNRIHKYMIYDTYIVNDNDVKNLPLISENNDDTRIAHANNIVLKLQEAELIDENVFSPKLEINVKHFEIATNLSNIFDKSNIIWNNYTSKLSDYKYDGLIYTPINEPVGYNDDNLDYDINTNNTWFRNKKWKPEYENTIDFLIEIEKDSSISSKNKFIKKEKEKLKHVKSPSGNSSIKKYKSLKLFVGDIENNNRSKKKRYLKSLFVPKTPYDKTANVSNQFLTDYGEIVCYDFDRVWKPTKEIVKDDTIVEFAYRPENEQGFKWIPIKNRQDKTYSYKKGVKRQKYEFKVLQKYLNGDQLMDEEIRIVKNLLSYFSELRYKPYVSPNMKKKIQEHYPSYNFIDVKGSNYGNNFMTANNVWRSINNPVTEKIITTGQNIPDISEEKYYRRDVFQKRSKSLTISLQHFHNIIIKNYSLIMPVANYLKNINNENINLLDLACGKGGDIPKWIENNIDNILGIDIVKNNIHDDIDGALVRLNNFKERYGDISTINFLVGDSSKNIKSGQAFADKSKWEKIWKPKYKREKFHIISIMFALHYMFKNKIDVQNLVDNISENLRNGGYFIGTCLDGKEIFDMLNSLEQNENLVGYKNGKAIWKIKKLYSRNTFPDNDDSLNYPIDVWMSSINSVITEYLVNFDYFKKKLEEKNIKLITSTEHLSQLGISKSSGLFGEIYNELLIKSNKESNKLMDIFKKINKNMTEDEKKISFKGRYFIFQKVSDEQEKILEYCRIILESVNNSSMTLNQLQDFIDNDRHIEIRQLLDPSEQQSIDFESELWDGVLQELNTKVKLLISEKEEEEKEEKITLTEPVKKKQIDLDEQVSILDKFNKVYEAYNSATVKYGIAKLEEYDSISNLLESDPSKTNKYKKFLPKVIKFQKQYSDKISLFREDHNIVSKYNNLTRYIDTLRALI